MTPAEHDSLVALAASLDVTADVFTADGSSWATLAGRELRFQAEGVRLALYHLTRETEPVR